LQLFQPHAIIQLHAARCRSLVAQIAAHLGCQRCNNYRRASLKAKVTKISKQSVENYEAVGALQGVANAEEQVESVVLSGFLCLFFLIYGSDLAYSD